MNTFVSKDGIAPQILVAMNSIVDNNIEYLLPTRSARNPHTMDPRTVADMAIVGSLAPSVLDIPYSFKRPKEINNGKKKEKKKEKNRKKGATKEKKGNGNK